ncbi:MAG: ATP-binding protein [Elusimicrobiales bacterium]|nr:ATP-binding protein [Elusimicrobiales bacterium]
MKLTTRFLLILLGIAVLPLLLSVGWNVYQYNSSVASYFELHKGLSGLSAVNVDEWFLTTNRSLAFLYEIENPLQAKKLDEAKVIQQAARINSDIMSLSLLSQEGKEVFFIQSDKVREKKSLASFAVELSSRAHDSGIVTAGDPVCVKGQAFFPLAYPLVDGRVVLFHFAMDKLLGKINSQHAGRTGRVFISDGQGRPLPCQDMKGLDYKPAEMKKAFHAGGRTGTLAKFEFSGEEYAGAYAAIDKLDWAAVSIQSEDELYGKQRKSILVFSLLAVAIFGITMVVVFLISNRIIVPINNMVNSVKGFLRTQHLDQVIAQQGWPEIRVLVGVLNRLMLELQAYRAFQLNQIVEEKGKAQALIDTISDGVVLVDDRGSLIYSNNTALKLLGIPKISPEVALPRSVKNEAFFKGLTDMMAIKEKYLRVEIDAPVETETSTVMKSFRVISNQFLLATLKRPGRVLIIRDITSEKEIEKAKEDFFHMITHDMRAPLSTLQGYTELLMKKIPSSPSTDKYLTSMLYSSRRLRGMIDDILNTTKLERGNMTLGLDLVDAGAIITRVRENHEPVAGPKNIKLSVVLPPSPIMVTADPGLLERVITNLMGNSLKFTPGGGSIILSTWETKDEVFFAVEDTGPGIPENKRKEIFEKYSQMEEHKSMGFGLGLAMCKMTVELHKGNIWVESEVGKGSKFIFTVSKSMAVPAPAAPPAPPPPPAA